PITAIAASRGQTIVRSAPRYRTACEKATKCGVGLVICIKYCSQTGMLSIGVALPDSSCMMRRTGAASSANWPIVVAIVPLSAFGPKRTYVAALHESAWLGVTSTRQAYLVLRAVSALLLLIGMRNAWSAAIDVVRRNSK